MSNRSIRDHFRLLGAPLKCYRRSWGAVRADGAVILRVWSATNMTENGKRYAQLSGADWNPQGDSWGFDERAEHIGLIRSGAKCLLVMCSPKDETAEKWEIGRFDHGIVWEAGELLERDGDTFIEIVGRKTADQVRRGA